MEINRIQKMMVFGSNLSTDDIINLLFEALKHQGVGQKMMTG